MYHRYDTHTHIGHAHFNKMRITLTVKKNIYSNTLTTKKIQSLIYLNLYFFLYFSMWECPSYWIYI